MIYISICDDREEDILTLKKYVRYYLKQMNLKFKLDCFLSGKDLLFIVVQLSRQKSKLFIMN